MSWRTGSYVYDVNTRSENFLLLVRFSFDVRKVYKIQDTRYKNFIHQFWAQQGHTKMMHMKEEKSK